MLRSSPLLIQCTSTAPNAHPDNPRKGDLNAYLTLTGIILSAVVSCLLLGGLYVALTSEARSVSIILPWPLVGAILAGFMAISIITSTLPAWCQLRRCAWSLLPIKDH
jgi:hypothetical protein